MVSKMQRETIDIQKCKKDIKEVLKREIIGFLVVCCAIVFCALFLAQMKRLPMIMILVGFAFVCAVGRVIKIFLIISKENFDIVQDSLVSKRKRLEDFILKFQENGSFELPQTCYKWSEGKYRSGEKVYDEAEAGETFYLVVSRRGKREILACYSLKDFEM